jgi:hypothetical protein
MSRRQHGEWLKDKKSSNDVIANTTQGKSTEEMTRGIGGIKNPDGSPFLAYGETGAVTELRNQVVAARSVARLMDEVTRLRSGWTSDSARSEEWQRIKANWAQVKGLAKNLLKLGALSESDYELVDGFIGSPDPTGYRDPTAGILKARENLIQSTQDALAGAGYEGRFDIPRPKLAPPTESASDREFKDALRTPNAGEIMKAAQSGAGIVAPGREYDSDDVVLPTVRSTIDRLTQVAKSGPKVERDAARAQLEKLLTHGGTRGVRSAAEAALIEVGRPTESDGPRQATVKDSISEPVR